MRPFRTLCDAVVSVAVLTIVSAAVIPAAGQAHAQEYPTKPVTIISDSAAGSTPDAVLRVIADRLSQMWGQQILAVNHPGATGSIASRIAADSAPDVTCRCYPASWRCLDRRPTCQSGCPGTLPQSASRPKIPCSSSPVTRSALIKFLI